METYNQNQTRREGTGLMRGLLISHRGKKCGVQQFGRRLFNTLEACAGIAWSYAECGSMVQFLAVVEALAPDLVVLNDHPMTLGWAADESIRRCGVPCFAVFHECYQEAVDALVPGPFDFHLCPDPTLLPWNPLALLVPRFIPAVRPGRPPDVFTVGSFGFASANKGLERLCALVNKEFDNACIRINLPPHDLQSAGLDAGVKDVLASCRYAISKPGIELRVTRTFMDEEALLAFLSENTINVFLYHGTWDRGISSCTDYALACGRPIAVSLSSMFRHLHGINPSIVVDDRSLRDIAASGVVPLAHHVARYSAAAAGAHWTDLILEALALHRMSAAMPDGLGFNKTLGAASRAAYGAGCVQAAFAVDAVTRLVARYFEPDILVVGKADDATAGMLQARGFRLDLAEPKAVLAMQWRTWSRRVERPSYDIVVGVSVFEDVGDGGAMVRELAELLAPNGVAILTLARGGAAEVRGRLAPVAANCGLLDVEHWSDGDGAISWVFRKFDEGALRQAARPLPEPRTPHVRLLPVGAPVALLQEGEVLAMPGTMVGRADTDGEMQVFVAEGDAIGFLAFGPYCTQSPGRYRCTFLLRIETGDLPGDTAIAVIDVVSQGVELGTARSLEYGAFPSGDWTTAWFEFELPAGSYSLETRLALTYPVRMTVAAYVAIRSVR